MCSRRFRAFSLLELVVVVAIMGVVASIAVLRMVGASSNATIGNLQANVTVLEKAIAHYAAEHDNRTPADAADGSVDTDEVAFVRRIMQKTDADGGGSGVQIFGPYLLEIPANPYNSRRHIRIDGALAGANTHGWRFNSTTRVIEPDDRVSSGVSVVGGPDVGGGGKVSNIAPAIAD